MAYGVDNLPSPIFVEDEGGRWEYDYVDGVSVLVWVEDDEEDDDDEEEEQGS
jgi:hypothetical protein